MRDQMSSFDIARMVLEIDALAGARCRKVYQPHYEQVVLRLNPKGMSNRDLVIVRGQRTYFSQRDRLGYFLLLLQFATPPFFSDAI